MQKLTVVCIIEKHHITTVCNCAYVFVLQEIIPFIDEHWEQLTVAPRRVKHTWHSSIAKTMVRYLCAGVGLL